MSTFAQAAQRNPRNSEPEPEAPKVFEDSDSLSDSSEEDAAEEQGCLVVTVQGPNGPGRVAPFIAIIAKQQHQARILDMAQYVIEDALVFSLMLQHGAVSSIALIRELVSTARHLNLKINFSFPGNGPEARLQAPPHSGVQRQRRISFVRENCQAAVKAKAQELTVAIEMLVRGALPAQVLRDTLGYLSDTGSKMLEIKQSGGDRIVVNEIGTKLSLRVRCPSGVTISELQLHLQAFCCKYCTEVVVREWEGMDRPNGKSLVVFGLSDVLCPHDVLDEVLCESGIDPSVFEETGENSAMAKVRALKGKDARCMQKAAQNLQFTPGAHLVCQSLKELGFRLALISNTGCKLIVDRAKKELNLDYAICRDLEVAEDGAFTGHFATERKDQTGFVKLDYLKLLAEREGIDPRNVMIVGTFTHGMTQGDVRMTLDTYGPVIHFHAPALQNPTLVSVLYLMGFSGSDVDEMQSRHKRVNGRHTSPKVVPETAVLQSFKTEEGVLKFEMGTGTIPDGRRYLLRVRSESNELQSLVQLIETLLPYCEAGQCSVDRIQQVTMMAENALIGLSLDMVGQDQQAALKDIIFRCHQLGLSVDWDEQESEQTMPPRTEQCIVTIVQNPCLKATVLGQVFQAMASLQVDCTRFERLSDEQSFAALQITAAVPPVSEGDLRAKLLAISKEQDVDIAFQRDGIDRWGRRMIVFDMDSTLIQQEVIDELAKQCGVEETVGEITERAMRGELDFFESLKERVALLKGHNSQKLFGSVKQNLLFTPGALQLCRTLKHLGYKMAVISGGFMPCAREVQRKLGLDYAFANTLETDKDGTLTGLTVGAVVTPQRKQALLEMIAQVEGCDLRQTVAVGDGSNDIPMLMSAGLGIAFCAKPKVQAAAEFRVNNKDLSTVLFLIGLSETAAQRLLDRSCEDDSMMHAA
eukprot:TRINITY_DN1572_c0_g1_i4.p1 TRINITY_DN1572_c0_g1~~TRINITY_DN1572_c0_g1_i4.p1  ORF type:complete len:924 (+),score=194.45 TRINITY_DN1572_c0_g1_i4:104-2875(+)